MATVIEISSAIAAIIAVIKVAYELGVEVWPNVKILIGNLETLFNAYVNGTDISDEQLAAIQAQTSAMSAACHAAYLEKYGENP